MDSPLPKFPKQLEEKLLFQLKPCDFEDYVLDSRNFKTNLIQSTKTEFPEKSNALNEIDSLDPGSIGHHFGKK